MSYKVTTPPAIEPLSLAEGKAHLRVTHTSEDDLFTDYIQTARIRAEGRSHRAFCEQTVLYTMDDWPSGKTIFLPKAPLQSVTDVIYTDSDGTAHTLDPANYTVDTDVEPATITLNNGETWPSDTLFPRNAIKIEFMAGYATYIGTVDTAATAVTLASGDSFNTAWNRGQTLIIDDVVYRVASIAGGSTLTLQASAGTQTGVRYTANEVPEHFKQAMKVLISHYDNNREEVSAKAQHRVPEAAADLLAQDVFSWGEEWNT